MATTKRESYQYKWWFDSHNNAPGRSQWLQSTLSELDEKTLAMLRMIDEDADTFAERAEMYYEKRPQLVSMVEDLYRAQRSLAEQLDHLQHDAAGIRHMPSLARSKGQSEKVLGPHKQYDDLLPEKVLDQHKQSDRCYPVLAYDSEESVDSEVDNLIPEVHYEGEDMGEELSFTEVKDEKLTAEIAKLREEDMTRNQQLMVKEKAIEELKHELSERVNEAMELREETKKLRAGNMEMYIVSRREGLEKEKMNTRLKEETERLRAENDTLKKELLQKDEEKREAMKQLDEMKKLMEDFGVVRLKNEEQRELLNARDEEKREVIRQLSVAIEMLKAENVLLKKRLASKRWWLFNCSKMPQSGVVPL